MLRNSSTRFGYLAILLHWSIALLIVGEFALGLFMTDLDYHHPLYQSLPQFHESMGILVGVLLLIRIGWAFSNIRPAAESGVGPVERVVSRVVQNLMIALVIGVVVFGYLLSTAAGESILVFDWFYLPAVFELMEGEEDLCAFWHQWLAWSVMGFAGLHALGALKHHFYDRDQTLRRMLGLGNRSGN